MPDVKNIKDRTKSFYDKHKLVIGIVALLTILAIAGWFFFLRKTDKVEKYKSDIELFYPADIFNSPISS